MTWKKHCCHIGGIKSETDTLGAIQLLHNAVAVGVSTFPEKNRCECVRFNVISVTRGWWGSNFLVKSVTGWVSQKEKRQRRRERGGRVQCFMKTEDKRLIDVENVETTGEMCCHRKHISP